MGNKRTPRKVTITDVATLISSLQTRRSMTIRNVGANDVALSNVSTTTFAEGFPFPAGESQDDQGGGPIYGICDTGLSSDVWVWETE